MLHWAALLFLQAPALPDLPTVSNNPYTAAEDLAHGRKLYEGRCAGCHGPSGDGGKGTNLAVPQLPRAATDLSLYKVIRYGLPDTEMPGHNLTPKEIWQISSYVRMLGQSGSGGVKGDSERGSALVRGKGGCLNCHLVDGTGGLLGPALDDIGQRRSVAYLRTKLLEPSAGLSGDFRMVELTTGAGSKISGVRVNEDTFSLQVRDMKGQLQSFWKHDLAGYKVHRRTPMPSYRSALSEQEVDDILIYLSTLRGGR